MVGHTGLGREAHPRRIIACETAPVTAVIPDPFTEVQPALIIASLLCIATKSELS
jgi:hypothetical protein